MSPSFPLATPSSTSSPPPSNGHTRPHLQARASLRDQVAALRVTGLGPALIAEELHRSRDAVLKIIQTLSAKSCEAAQPISVTPPEGDRRSRTSLASTNLIPSHQDPTPPAPGATLASVSRPTSVQVPALTAFYLQVLELHATGLSYTHIAERLHCTFPQIASAFRVSRKTGALRSKSSPTLTSHARSTAPSPPRPSTADPSTSHILTLRQQGLSIRQIATRLNCTSTSPVTRTLTRHKIWNTPGKRGHEAAIFTLVRDVLPTPPTGVAIALTADQLIWHLDALEGVVTRLVAVEREPDVIARMVTTLSRSFALPLSVHLGDFWDIARRLPDPIAFLDYDGMGALPARLQDSLAALAPRLTTPCVIRLTCSMAYADCLKQVPQAAQALLAIPGFHVTRLDMRSTPSSHGHMAMTTMLAVLTQGDPHASLPRSFSS